MRRPAQRAVAAAVGVAGLLAVGPPAWPEAAEAPPEEDRLTVITSERLTYDAEDRTALFERDVVVVDPGFRLTADRLTVRFDEENAVRTVVAEGNVVMTQEEQERRAWAGRAEYDVPTGRIVLEQEPRVEQGRDVLEGERITFWRDGQRLVCEPGARLTIHAGPGGLRATVEGDH